jgi:uncharacterized membrane protein
MSEGHYFHPFKKMVNKDKLRIEIEKLKSKREYNIFQFNNCNSLWIGAIAFLLALFIPLMISVRENLIQYITLAFFLLISLKVIHYKISKKTLNNVENEIEDLTKKINKKYEELLK